MNFYSFHIGDYATKTRHLSWDQDLAYRRLIEVYYAYEVPLPFNRQQVYRLVTVYTPKQKKAVDEVISEFFQETAEGYRHTRCDEEIATAQEKRSKASASARKRWGSDGTSTAVPTHSEGNAPNPRTGEGGLDWAALESQLRTAAGWEREPHPKLAVVGPIVGLIEAGASLEKDVLPIVKALASSAKTRTSWSYFLKAIEQAWRERTGFARNGANGFHVQQVDDAKWTERMEWARKNNQWGVVWGPMPGQSGCAVPANLLKPADGQGWTIWKAQA